MRRLLFGLCLLLALVQARAEERLFYQPLNVDAALSQQDWTQLWQASAQQGVRTLIVQWSAYGDADFGGRDGWLAQSLRQARAQGLELVLGLYMDPAYYQRSNELDSAGLAAYWQYQLGRSLALQQRLRQDWQLPVAGWYLPLELDDLHFQAPERRQALQAQIKDFAGQLDAPLHLSAFSAGKLAPQTYAGWLAGLGELGIQVWWQDGAGTGSLAPLVRQAYERALPCTVGVVREAFRQTSAEGQPFRAVPAEPQALSAGCHAVALFELRYRPWGARLLK
ncbi:DUF4434 family protein [Pseudomonas cavernae]|uniref:DUF4434 family protein n=1 Tax=Pseudomonas cavernae TaxID=2320867 RepID=A0A385Z1M9_9PSED|nr:DUF4434 family protein [Pseudomonas cavernae]AYC32037.1 DUF4434 family protein [Pseudomonas cavernae]